MTFFFPFGKTDIGIATFVLWMTRLRHREVNFPNVTYSRKAEIESITLSFQNQWSFYCAGLLSNVSHVFFFLMFSCSLRLLLVHWIYFALSHYEGRFYLYCFGVWKSDCVFKKSNCLQRSMSPWLLSLHLIYGWCLNCCFHWNARTNNVKKKCICENLQD